VELENDEIEENNLDCDSHDVLNSELIEDQFDISRKLDLLSTKFQNRILFESELSYSLNDPSTLLCSDEEDNSNSSSSLVLSSLFDYSNSFPNSSNFSISFPQQNTQFTSSPNPKYSDVNTSEIILISQNSKNQIVQKKDEKISPYVKMINNLFSPEEEKKLEKIKKHQEQELLREKKWETEVCDRMRKLSKLCTFEIIGDNSEKDNSIHGDSEIISSLKLIKDNNSFSELLNSTLLLFSPQNILYNCVVITIKNLCISSNNSLVEILINPFFLSFSNYNRFGSLYNQKTNFTGINSHNFSRRNDLIFHLFNIHSYFLMGREDVMHTFSTSIFDKIKAFYIRMSFQKTIN
jgi:hypothetical protein